jgi:hypothetical protein
MPLTYILTIFFPFGIFYYAAMTTIEWKADFCSPWARVGGSLGLACALAGATNYDVSAGRWGGYFWWCAAHLPVIGGRSVLFLVTAPLGGMLIGVMTGRLVQRAGRDTGWLWLCSFASWAFSFLPNRLVFHRYYEPATLIFLTFWTVLLVRSEGTEIHSRPRLLHGLAFGQLLLTFATVYHPTFGPSLMSAL